MSGVARAARGGVTQATPGRRRHDSIALSPRAAALVGWCGMRGIVTLAAALLCRRHPARRLSFRTATSSCLRRFAVVLGTLILQGLTLRPLMTRLQLEDDGSVEREVRLARVAALEAALAVTSGLPADARSRSPAVSLRSATASCKCRSLRRHGVMHWTANHQNDPRRIPDCFGGCGTGPYRDRG